MSLIWCGVFVVCFVTETLKATDASEPGQKKVLVGTNAPVEFTAVWFAERVAAAGSRPASEKSNQTFRKDERPQ